MQRENRLWKSCHSTLLCFNVHFRQFDMGLPASCTRCVSSFIGPQLTRIVTSPQQRPSSIVRLRRELLSGLIENTVEASAITAPTLLGLMIDGCIKNCNVRHLRNLQGVGALLTILTASFYHLCSVSPHRCIICMSFVGLGCCRYLCRCGW
jgi:hypothetical protein